MYTHVTFVRKYHIYLGTFVLESTFESTFEKVLRSLYVYVYVYCTSRYLRTFVLSRKYEGTKVQYVYFEKG